MSIVFHWLIVTKINFLCTSIFIYILGIYLDYLCLISPKSSWCAHLGFTNIRSELHSFSLTAFSLRFIPALIVLRMRSTEPLPVEPPALVSTWSLQ